MKTLRNVEMRPKAVIHTDVTSMIDQSLGRARYSFTLLDESSGYVKALYLKAKGDITELVKCNVYWLSGREKYSGQKIVLDI